MRASLSGREAELEGELASLTENGARQDELRRTAGRLMETERKAVQDAAHSGLIDEKAAKTLLAEITERTVRLEAEGVPELPGGPSESPAE